MNNQNGKELQSTNNAEQNREYVLRQLRIRIGYYWRAGKLNKQAYKLTRYLTVILGALVTLVASLSSSGFVESSPNLSLGFAITTPLLAAFLAIVGGFSQNFQWGAGWKEMVLCAQNLQREYDRIQVTQPDAIDAATEMQRLNDMLLAETEGFFSRILGAARPSSR